MLERLGVNTRGTNLRTANVAAVMVTANLPPFSTQGTRMDVTVSALGDAKSLQGGTLLVTPLLGADGEVYAVAQGSLAIGGFPAEGEAAKHHARRADRRPHPNGAIIEREVDFKLNRQKLAEARAAQPGFHHGAPHRRRRQRLLGAEDRRAGRSRHGAAQRAPKTFKGNIVALLTEIEQLRVEPDQRAKHRHRRALRHHRHGPRRARLHRRRGAGQPHRHDLRAPAGQPAQPLSRADRAWCRAPHQATEEGKRLAHREARASRCASSSTGSMRSASARAT
jgi:hypothetical protein